jgi:methionyl-tRNA formyltransferase
VKLVFWGTPAYAVPSLEALVAAGHRLVGVVSQPDRRRGRGKQLQPSAVKARALELGIPVFTPERIRRDPLCQQQLADLAADAYVVVAFGQILPPEVLAQPRLGCWNAHGSLLPRWRGAAPIQWCLLEGDSQSGVGIMAMEEGLDTGPVLLEQAIPVGLLENAEQLGHRLAQLSADLLVEAMPQIEAGRPVHPQADAGLTYARLLSKADTVIDWGAPALAIHRKVMGLYPTAQTSWQGKRLKLLASEPLVARLEAQLSPDARALLGPNPVEPGLAPGTILSAVPGVGLVVASGGCPVLIREAQLEGKAPARGQSLIQQLGAEPGDRLGGESTLQQGDQPCLS